MRTEITSGYHRRIIWIRVMIEVAEIAEVCASLGEALQKVVFNGRLIVLIFEDDDEHVVEMLWRGRGSGRVGGVLAKTEHRNGPNAECYTCERAAVPIAERHVFSKFLVVIEIRRRSSLKGCSRSFLQPEIG